VAGDETEEIAGIAVIGSRTVTGWLPLRMIDGNKAEENVNGTIHEYHARKTAQQTDPSAPLGISARGSDAARTPQQEILRLRSGFRLRAPASLTPAKRLNFTKNRPQCVNP